MCHAMQYRQVIVKTSDKMWSIGGGNGKPLQDSCCENPMNGMKRQKDMTLEDAAPPPPRPTPGCKVSNILLGKSGGQLLIALERMKWLG